MNVAKITFWGVRGSYPVPGKETIEFGGNTPCVQLQLGDQLLILDAGTGISNLGNRLIQAGEQISAHLLITHPHWDHIQGFPFFKPAFQKGNKITIYGIEKIDQFLNSQMSRPFFPVQLKDMAAELKFIYLKNNVTFKLKQDSILIRTFRTGHPGLNLAYRIEYQEKVCCYITDYEHKPLYDDKLVNFIQGADIVIYDAHFTESEYQGINEGVSKKGWGHSTWEQGIRLIKAAGVKQFIPFHHAPEHTDQQLKANEKTAQTVFSNCIFAREGMVVKLC